MNEQNESKLITCYCGSSIIESAWDGRYFRKFEKLSYEDFEKFSIPNVPFYFCSKQCMRDFAIDLFYQLQKIHPEYHSYFNMHATGSFHNGHGYFSFDILNENSQIIRDYSNKDIGDYEEIENAINELVSIKIVREQFFNKILNEYKEFYKQNFNE